ncbi:MAG: glycosyltransferase [Desulfomonilia bacterium]
MYGVGTRSGSRAPKAAQAVTAEDGIQDYPFCSQVIPEPGIQRKVGYMVSIIIVTMGQDDPLDQCLSSLNSHVRCPYEIILVNNSPDALHPRQDLPVQIVENGRNMGFARAVNRGIFRARGDMILLLNSDIVFMSDAVSPMVTFLSDHPRCIICGPQLVFPDGRKQNSVDVIPNLMTQTLNKSLLKILFPGLYPSKRSGFTRPVMVPSVIGACMMIRKELFDAIGVLDEGFFFYLEETDFCKRARDAGYEVWHLPHIPVIHHQGITAKKTDLRRKVEYQRSIYRFFRKHKGKTQYLVLYMFTVLKLVFECVFHMPLTFSRSFRDRLKKSVFLLLWHLLGHPLGWGMERSDMGYALQRMYGYTWYLAPGSSVPVGIQDLEHFMETFSTRVVNRSRTAVVKFGQLGEETIFLKKYTFKGIRDSLKNLFRKSRARRAFEASLLLEELGIATPGVLFGCEKRVCGILLASYLATRYVDAPDLSAFIKANTWGEHDLLQVARFIRRIHEMGVVHTDLKAENLLIGHDAIYLIDLDRLHRVRFPTVPLIAKNLSYLNASLIGTLPEHVRCSLLQEYLKGNTHLEDRREALISALTAYTNKRMETRYSE